MEVLRAGDGRGEGGDDEGEEDPGGGDESVRAHEVGALLGAEARRGVAGAGGQNSNIGHARGGGK